MGAHNAEALLADAPWAHGPVAARADDLRRAFAARAVRKDLRLLVRGVEADRIPDILDTVLINRHELAECRVKHKAVHGSFVHAREPLEVDRALVWARRNDIDVTVLASNDRRSVAVGGMELQCGNRCDRLVDSSLCHQLAVNRIVIGVSR